jgi:hypothetical protein
MTDTGDVTSVFQRPDEELFGGGSNALGELVEPGSSPGRSKPPLPGLPASLNRRSSKTVPPPLPDGSKRK